MRLIVRIFALLAALLLGLCSFVFARLWYDAVPRATCDWGVDFCSDYGPVYAGLSVLSLLSLLFLAWWVFRAIGR